MKQFITVLKFELANYIKNRTYMVTTILMAVVLGALMFLPRVLDLTGLVGESQGSVAVEESVLEEQEEQVNEEESSQTETYLLFDPNEIVNQELLEQYFPGVMWQEAESEEEIRTAVEQQNALAGFCVTAEDHFTYYVFNKSMTSGDTEIFSELLGLVKQLNYCEEHDLNFEEVSQVFQFADQVQYEEEILGKDMVSNYFYCYAFVILIFMMIIMYGVMIATSVTTEKSNRSIEVLVTSTSSNSLIFGKVIAGAIAGICQVGIILGAILLSYQINREAWNGFLDPYLNIPIDVLVTFALFGIGGYLFYAFLYGAVGALVSKTEDINKSSSGLQMVIMIVYFVVLVQLTNVDGIVIKVASFLPFSSYSAMFARVAMGNVEMWEIIASFIILVVSVVAAGLIGAKIYRMGTLRYGNPVKFSHALKSVLRKE